MNNDGSKDDSLKKLIEEYELKKRDVLNRSFILTKTIREIYKSRNKAYKGLTVVDKENRGKADALNTGINICKNNIICCINVDCILEHDPMLKLIKPFLNNEKKVIASGGVIRVANSRVQVLEYFRAFLMGRMAWSRVDGLLLISGAFGMFDKPTVIKAGGYNTNTVGEDMELLVRKRRMMREKEVPYTVGFVPDPLC